MPQAIAMAYVVYIDSRYLADIRHIYIYLYLYIADGLC